MKDILLFDERGNLTPYQLIKTNLATVEWVFDTNVPDSLTRSSLLSDLKTLCNAIRQQIDSGFTVWINGSFATQKLNPNDIGTVFFIHSTDFELHENALRQLVNRGIRKEQGMDCYLFGFTQKTIQIIRQILSLTPKSGYICLAGPAFIAMANDILKELFN